MSNTDPMKNGEMQFLDSSKPGIAAGKYQITVKHDIDDLHDIKGNYEHSQEFIVQAPRFTLPPNSVQSLFPSPESNTDFHSNLPYIMLQQENLPWSRDIGGTVVAGTPWMALMIFRADEIEYKKPEGEDANPTLSTLRDVKKEVEKFISADTIGPKIKLDDIEEKMIPPLRANTIDVFYHTFKQLVPFAEELPFLAHIRKTNSGGFVADGETSVRTYACLLGNRLANPNTETQYIAHLISLEGWGDYLPGKTPPVPPIEGLKLRLVSLHSWKFNNKKDGVNFRKLVDNMSVDNLKLPFSPPADWGDVTNYTPAQKAIQEKYKNGYIPLNYDTRTGEKSFAWYRGPFMPTIPLQIEKLAPTARDKPYQTHIALGDEAIIYDADNGLFDHSYAVAWELGRMLTLGNRPAAIAIWQWRKLTLQKMQVLNRMVNDKQRRRKKLLGTTENLSLSALLKGLDWRQMRDDLMDDQAGKYMFMNYLGGKLGKHLLGTDKAAGPAIKVLDPTGLQQHLDEMPGVLSKGELLGALKKGTDPHVLISEKLEATFSSHDKADK